MKKNSVQMSPITNFFFNKVGFWLRKSYTNLTKYKDLVEVKSPVFFFLFRLEHS